MRPQFEKVTTALLEKSFVYKRIIRRGNPTFDEVWHYHPELEICFTEVGSGKRFVGNDISPYQAGELVLLGDNLPHAFVYRGYSKQHIIQFKKDFLGQSFLDKPEVQSLKSLFLLAKRGINFGINTTKKLAKRITTFDNTGNIAQLIELLDLLRTLEKSKDNHFICKEEYVTEFNIKQFGRIGKVYDYLLQNFRQDIKVKTLAEQINLTESSFYKFIRRHTKKNFTKILNELRINYATNLLSSTDRTVSQICFDAGYHNTSYFNRKFKEIMNQTPQQFRINYTKTKR